MDEARLRVELVYALPGRYWNEQLELPEGATVADALARTGLHVAVPGFAIDFSRIAIHGQLVALERVLADGDRIELLRPLLHDPKDVRRRRAGQDRAGQGRAEKGRAEKIRAEMDRSEKDGAARRGR
jgi:hypothetical protein